MRRRLAFLFISIVLGTASTVGLAWCAAYASHRLESAYSLDPPGDRLVLDVPSSVTGFVQPDPVVIVEVAPSWGTELWGVMSYGRAELPGTVTSRGTLIVPGWVARVATPWMFDPSLPPAGSPAAPSPDIRRGGVHLLARGWPQVTMWSHSPEISASDTTITRNGGFYVHRLLPNWAPRDLCILPSAASHDMPLPLNPIWRPFLLWSGVWSLAWAAVLYMLGLLATLPKKVRRWNRTRRGRCVSCAYDRSALPKSAPCPECGLGSVRGPG